MAYVFIFLLFAITPMLFFTLAANILLAYVLPGVPAAALLAVILWTRSGRKGVTWLTLGVLEMTTVAIVAIGVSFLGLKNSPLPSEGSLIAAYSGPGRLAMLNPRSFFRGILYPRKNREDEKSRGFGGMDHPRRRCF